MSRSSPIDVAIAGGGHAGLLLAAGLAREGLRVAVIDPQPRERILESPANGRTLALLGSSHEVVTRLGAWPHCHPHAAPIWETRVRDVAGGAAVDYRARETFGQPFGYGFENHLLRRSLLAAAEAAAGPELLRTGKLATIERRRQSVALHLDHGGTLEAALLVGADGRGSSVRTLAGIGLERWTYRQTAIVFVVAHQRAHGWRVREHLRPQGPLALLPLPGRRCGVTWVETHEEAAGIASLPPAALAARLHEQIGDVLGALEIDGPVGRWPLSAQHAARYVAPRIALVGDAAHGAHPIHAQGFNMGVADIGCLCEQLVRARRHGQDLGGGDALIPYERARRPANMRRLWLTDGLNRLFSNDITPLAALRGAGMRMLDMAAPAKRAAMRHGMSTL
ncbi:FAD-dependent monooxygenase [Geminicoccaceae bacterium 1502E]|nr:FAD-dependent monooxygenase [Geminicoccaceae bacterium 1502E]